MTLFIGFVVVCHCLISLQTECVWRWKDSIDNTCCWWYAKSAQYSAGTSRLVRCLFTTSTSAAAPVRAVRRNNL